MPPQVSVVIPTFNRTVPLRRVLAGLEKQSCPLKIFEVIVVSDGAADAGIGPLRAMDTPLELQVAAQERQGAAAARNRGVELARGDIVLFLDDDVAPDPALVAEHLQSHTENGDDTCVIGPLVAPSDYSLSPWVRWELKMLEKQYDAMRVGTWLPTARQFYTGNASVKRQALVQAGGFDARFGRAEDVELGYRLQAHGEHFVFNPNAIGYHYAERTFAEWLEIPYVYGRTDVILTQSGGQEWLLPTVFRELRGRHGLVRWVNRILLDRRKASEIFIAVSKRVSEWSDRLGIFSIARFGYSGIFNLRYYQGIADELGGRARFFAAAQLAPEPDSPRAVSPPQPVRTHPI